MKKILHLSFLTIVLLTSCKKDSLTRESKLSTSCETDPGFISGIKSSSCSSQSPYKFQATINGKQICFDKPVHPNSVTADLWMTSYRNTIYSARVNADSSIMIGMTYANPFFNTSILPYAIPPVNGCELLTITISVIRPYDPGECEPYEKTIWLTTIYWGLTLNCKIISFKDNVIEGVFDGKYVSKKGNIVVTDGYFNIKLKIEQE